MTSGPAQDAQNQDRHRIVGKAAGMFARVLRWAKNVREYFSGRGGWYWIPVGFVGACSTAASSIVFMGAIITGRQEDRLELTIFLYNSAVIVMAGPIALMIRIIDSARAWVDPNFTQPPAWD